MNTRKLNMIIDRVEMRNYKLRNKIRVNRRNQYNMGAKKVVLGFIAIGFVIIVIVNFIGSKIVPEAKAEELPIQIQSVDLTLIDTPWRTMPKLENGSDEQNEKIAYAYKISGYDIDFIYTLNGENGLWTHDRIHDSSANTIGVDMGFGINSYFHPEIVTDPKFWSDWRWNIDRTYQLYANNTTFYGYSKKGIYF